VEPFALQASAPGLIRPTIDLQSDLSAVLREGRVMSGEVLQTLDGDTILVGVGSHRVPARSRVRMQPGHKFLFQVQREGDGIVLRVLGQGAGEEAALLQALRQVMGQEQPLGELLQRLADTLRMLAGEASTSPAAGKLLRELSGHLFAPGAAGDELRARLGDGGLAYEARLADSALKSLPGAQLRELARELRATLLEGLTNGLSARSPQDFGTALRGALVELLGGERELEAGVLKWAQGRPLADGDEPLPRDLGRLLARALARLSLRADGAAVAANLHQAELASLGRGLQQVLLRALLGLPARGGAGPVDLGWAGVDLKGRLLRALGELPAGAARDAVGQALSGLEADQLLNRARIQAHEPLHWSLLVADGDRWTTGHLFFRRAGDEEERHAATAGAQHRMTVAIDFSHTGPVRADLVAQPGALAMRVTATRPEVVARMRAALPELEQQLAAAGRRVNLVVAQAPIEQVRIEPGDIRYLRDHRLMDTSG
jgi:hypothetical protein